jgi:protein-tyrosine phosphatase
MEPDTPSSGSVTDLHNHLMPGVDDGAANEVEARAGLIAMREAGVARIVTTPHVDASAIPRRTWGARMEELDAAWTTLKAIAAEATPGLILHRAAEIKLDLPEPDLSDERLRIAGGNAVLVEFAYFTVPPYSDRMIARLVGHGLIPVIAHPERYRGSGMDATVVAAWRAAGGRVQVNVGSLTGRYGVDARKNAIRLLTAGLIDCLASDYHSRGIPELAPAREWLEAAGAGEHAELLLDVNPARIVSGEMPLQVPALDRKPGLLLRLWNAVRKA